VKNRHYVIWLFFACLFFAILFTTKDNGPFINCVHPRQNTSESSPCLKIDEVEGLFEETEIKRDSSISIDGTNIWYKGIKSYDDPRYDTRFVLSCGIGDNITTISQIAEDWNKEVYKVYHYGNGFHRKFKVLNLSEESITLAFFK